jgi:putative ABC transport system permease protein
MREMWGWNGIERLWQDSKYAARSFRRSPGFVFVALLSLALGIGATTALFSVVYGVLIAPYPYAKTDEIWAPSVNGPNDTPRGWHQYSREEFLEIRKMPVFSSVMATDPNRMLMTGDRSPENEEAIRVTGNAFDFLGVKPVLGRTIQPYDIGPGGEPAPVAVVSYGFWQRVFSGQPNVIGAKIVLDDVPHTIVGVMPPRFGWWTNSGVWLPMSLDLKDTRGINPIVRLAPGVTPEAAAASLQAAHLRMAEQHPRHFPAGQFRTTLLNYMDITSASGEMTSSLHLLLAAVGFLVLIACANVANLQLARTTARLREIAMRLSIGASRGRIVRQLLTESVLLSMIGGVMGILFAVGLTRGIVALMPSFYMPNEARIAVNGWVLLFSFVVSVLTGILFGLAPAIQCTRPNLTDALKDGSRGSGGSNAGRRMRGVLVMAEVAMTVILLAGTSLAVRSFAELLRIDPGFQPERTLMVNVPLPPKQYKTIDQRNAFARSLLQRVASLPGVESASIGNGGTLFDRPQSAYSIDGSASVPTKSLRVALISADFARTLGIPLKRGRGLSEEEVARGAAVALINETAARLWPAGVDAIGRNVSLDVLGNAGGALLPASPDTHVTVVGILGDTRNAGLRGKTDPAVFVAYTLIAPSSRTLAVRTRGEPMAMLNAIRSATREMDKQLPIERPITLQEMLGQETAQPRFTMSLLACFAAMGLALAAAGIYSVISCDVTQKVHEIGVRVALGATRGDVIGMVLAKSFRTVAGGLGIGLAGSIGLERISRFELFGAVKLDWISIASVIAALTVVALIASWAPARRAAAMHPVEALRYEA